MTYQHILVPVDGSPTSLAAVKQAADIAKAFGSEVTAVCVLSVEPFIAVEFVDTQTLVEDYRNKAKQEIQKTLDQAKALFAAEGVEVETRLTEGQEIYKEIINTAEEINADLIIMGSHGRKGIKKIFLGSVAQSVLAATHLPVMIIKQ
ncbi:universal stress protein [Acinetobacter radioresistens]|uniref:universal stress protein n=1 Tax=Acinetobacter radioresistens TaxID=40216 RepID=UPI0022468734|nr:universal stress protein [Acinetobacter radioresistens]MCX0335108.1 universal stress protein [Acinetobacter radioresistens]MCX0341011.1 universal stress protein [Acinetobacter radioresistens]